MFTVTTYSEHVYMDSTPLSQVLTTFSSQPDILLARSIVAGEPPAHRRGDADDRARPSASSVEMLVDPRVITGAPAWLKPLKFAISTAVYSLTLAWIFRLLTDWPRVRRVVGWTTAIVFVLEVAIIDTQAWRGTTSHFNVSTPLNATLFVVMGGAILLQTLVSVAVAVALWRQRVHRSGARLGAAFRHDADHRRGVDRPADDTPDGGAACVRPRRQAHDDCGCALGRRRDGGPGLPVTWFSREHGDLRVATFHRPARDPDTCPDRRRPSEMAPGRSHPSQRHDGGRTPAMRRCYLVPPLAGAARPVPRGTRSDGNGHRCSLDVAHCARLRLDRPPELQGSRASFSAPADTRAPASDRHELVVREAGTYLSAA